MHGHETVRRAYALADEGLTQTAIARELSVGQTTISRWLRQGPEATLASPMRSRASSRCPERCPFVVAVPTREYAYLLGQYLGDGSIVHTRSGVYRLFVSCCAAYPQIVDDCEQAIRAVLPHNEVGRRAKSGAIDVNAYSKHWPCLFPQHGPGRKHTRAIVLAPWQTAIALDAHPEQFVRGLIHSDGCRSLNTVRNATGKQYTYVRYQFTNRSDDIRLLFTKACDRLGVDWRRMNRDTISVARRDGVTRLESIVGPKT